MKNTRWSLCLGLIWILTAAACGNRPPAVQNTAVPTVPAEKTEMPAVPASENTGAFKVQPSDGVIDLSDFGMKITLPESVLDIPISVNGYVNDDYAVANLCMADETDPDGQDCIFGEVYAYPNQRSHELLVDEKTGMTGDMVTDLGENESLYYYVLRLDELRKNSPEKFEEQVAGMSGEQRARYEALLDALPDMIGGMELTEKSMPQLQQAEEPDADGLSAYRMQDLAGNEFRLGELISGNQVTMLNVWGITCGPCMREMPVLQKLREKYKDQGFEVIGLAADLLDYSGNIAPELVSEAARVTEELGVEYPNLSMPLDIRNEMKIFATPTSYLVDSRGQMIGDPILGTRNANQWEKLILNALSNEK